MTPLPLDFMALLTLSGCRSLAAPWPCPWLPTPWPWPWPRLAGLAAAPWPWAWPRLAGHRLDMEPRHVQLRHVQLPQKKKVHRHNLHLFT